MSNLCPRSFCCFVAILCWVGTAAADVIVVQEQTQAAIQTALNRVRPPGTVVLPPGRYQIDGTLFVRIDQLTLQGAGSDQTVLFRQIDGTTSSLLRSTGHAQVRVTGIRFEGVQEPSNGRE